MNWLKNDFFFLEMEFVLNKASYEAYNGMLRKEIIEIAEKAEEFCDSPGFFVDFLYDLNELQFINQDELNDFATKELEEVYKENISPFLVCHQLWQFGNSFKFLELVTMKFAIIFELRKVKSFMKDIKKLELLQAKVIIYSKTFF